MGFWNRWNTYVGGWMSLYVFSPMVAPYRRARNRWRLQLAYATAVVGTFLALGMLHQAAVYALNIGGEWRGLAGYAGIGVVVAAWSVLSRLSSSVTFRARSSHWMAAASSVVQRAALWALVIGVTSWLLG